MTAHTKPDLTALVNTLLPDNVAGEITPERLRTVCIDIIDSIIYGDDSILSQVLQMTSGDDAGLQVNGQLSVGRWNNPKELVVGQGDSTTETMITLQTVDDITFYDRTPTFSSEDGSAIGLFGGTAPGNTIYVGSDFIFSGVKVKIQADGLIEAGNAVAEYWDGTQWTDVNYMATNSDGMLDAYGTELAQNGNLSEQWYFNFDPYDLSPTWAQNEVNGETKFWARFRIATPISLDPTIEQIKLHTSRFEANGTGLTQYFGAARYKRSILSGVNNLVNNTAQSPSNESVQYAPGVTAGYLDNEFVNNTVDSKLFVLNIPEGLDTSIPVEVKVSWYVKGTATGDVELETGRITVSDGFVYDGSASIEAETMATTTVAVPSDGVRNTTTLYLDVESAKPGVAYLCILRRDSTGGNINDTVNDNVILTHVEVDGYFWKP